MIGAGDSQTARPDWRAALPRGVQWALEATLVMNICVLLHIPVLSAVVVLPIALIAPGYAFTLSIFGEAPHQGRVLTLALSAILSVAFYPLLALVLYAMSIRLSTTSVTVSTDCGILLFLFVFMLRKRLSVSGAPPPQRPHVSAPRPSTLWRGWRGGVLFGAIVVVVVAALALEAPFLPKPVVAPYTQFNLAGAWAQNHTVVRPRAHVPLTVDVSVTNHTQSPQTYRIVPIVDTNQTWAVRTVKLAAKATWSGTVQGIPPSTGCVHRLNISLYRQGSKTAESSLIVWLQGSQQNMAACSNGVKNGGAT